MDLTNENQDRRARVLFADLKDAQPVELADLMFSNPRKGPQLIAFFLATNRDFLTGKMRAEQNVGA